VLVIPYLEQRVSCAFACTSVFLAAALVLSFSCQCLAMYLQVATRDDDCDTLHRLGRVTGFADLAVCGAVCPSNEDFFVSGFPRLKFIY